MLEKQHEQIAFELTQSIKTLNHQILYLCDSDKDARLIKNELTLHKVLIDKLLIYGLIVFEFINLFIK